MLAGLFKAPTKYAPHVNLPAARARANDVLNNMVEAGFLTEGQIQTARRNPATPVNRTRETTPDYYLDWAFERGEGTSRPTGKLGNDRVLTVKTPLDTRHPAAGRTDARRHAAPVRPPIRRRPGRHRGHGCGRRASAPWSAARDYGQSQFNRATDALRQPGSSFKPFVYAAALTDEPEAEADLDRRRRADLPRQLVPAELRPLVLGRHAARLGPGAVDQLDPGPAVGARSARATPRRAAP